MTALLPFDRASAEMVAPEWYDFQYSRRLKPAFTPSFVAGILLLAFSLFIILSCVYVAVAYAIVSETDMGFILGAMGTVLVGSGIAIWFFAHDYEQRLKERRMTPYGRRLNEWLETDFIPWLQLNLAIYIDVNDAEQLIVRREFSHVSFRGTSMVRLKYDESHIIITREVVDEKQRRRKKFDAELIDDLD